LALFVEQGVVGLFTFLMLVGSVIRMGVTLYRTGSRSWERWRGVVVIAIMIGYLAPGLFNTMLHEQDPLRYTYIYVCIGAIAGLHGRYRAIAALYAMPLHSRQRRTETARSLHITGSRAGVDAHWF
jgi:hypothetical protein